MKIAVDARTLGSRPSGVGMYLNDFLKELINYKDLEFILLSDVAESEYIREYMKLGIEVRTSGKPIYKSIGVYSYFSFIKKQLMDIKPDIFWEVNTIIPINLKGSFKTMITIHDMFPIEYVKYFGFVYSVYFKHNLKKTLKNTDLILYNSNQTKETTEKLFPVAKEVKSCNAYIISNPLPKEAKTSDNGYMLYVGNMEKRKGVDLLLKAYEHYRKTGGKRHLVLAGKMQEADINELLDKTLKETDGITYMDYVTHEKKNELYANCSLFVFPSKAEGFGMPLLEVMKFRKPILAGNLSIYKEIVGDCINIFDLNGSERVQIDNLVKAMKDFDSQVDVKAYNDTLDKYSPERLGRIVYEFLKA